ncbi:MAG: nicotinamide-nucleotide amidohydrolase family protein [Bacteroidota bacterium]
MYNEGVINSIKDKLIASNESVAVAESVTSGHLQAALSMAENASLFYQGGLTTYNLGQKCRHLNIEPIHAEKCDCVSKDVAIKMAGEICKMFLSNWGIGITGYATPVPGKTEYGLYAYYAIVHNGEPIVAKKIVTQQNGAVETQVFYTNTVLEHLELLVEKLEAIPATT